MERPTYVKHRLVNILTINKIVSILYWEFDKNFDFSGESHDFWELVYVDKGEIIATAGKREVLLKQGDIIFHKPNEFHKLQANGESAPNVFVMTFDCHSPSVRYFRGKHLHLNAQQRKLIAQILEEATATFKRPFIDPVLNKPILLEDAVLGGQQMIRLYLEQLLILLMRGDRSDMIFSTKDTLDSHLVRQMISLLEENLCESMTIDEISHRLNYSRTYLCTAFKQETGCSIMQYYTEKKIEEAKRLLREGNLNITQISDRLNFCNPHYFSSTFKKIAHMSPREYQQSVQSGGGYETMKWF